MSNGLETTDEDFLSENAFGAIAAEHLKSWNESGPADADTPAVEAGDTATTEPAAPAVIEDADGRLRNQDGTFAAKPEEGDAAEEKTETEAAEAETTEPPETEDTSIELDIDDPEVVAFLEKYDGDLVEALKAATHAQRLIGQKSTEMQELKEAIAQQKQMLEQVNANLNRPPEVTPQQFAEVLEVDPPRAAEIAKAHGDVQALDVALKAWAEGTEEFEGQPFQAGMYAAGLMKEFEAAQASQAAAPAATPVSGDEAAQVAAVIQRHPDIEKYLPQIGAVAKEMPLLGDALRDGTPTQKAQALETAYEIAKSRLGADTSREALQQAATKASEEARTVRAKASVVSARRGSRASEDQPNGADQFKAAFRERMGLPLTDE